MSVGANFGPYRVVRQLGTGGMGAVYLGEHTLIGRHAAIKVLLPELSAQRKSVDRFFNEARATSVVSDPGIVQIYDFGFTAEHIAFIVMEYLDGEPLSARLDRLATLTPLEALRITRQVAGSLAATHSAGIVHRDLKPDNLFLVRDAEAPGGERAKILDFGIAKLGDDDPANRMITRTGQVIGTPVYMSPEQAGGKPIDHRADVYSLGCVLFQMLTGRPPFDGGGMYAVISAHLRDPAPRLTEVAPHLPAELDSIVARCLAKSPGDRFANMLELQAACDAVLASAAPELAVRRPASSLATTTPAMPPMQTTLGQSVGEPLGMFATRRRVGFWIGGSAVAIAVGVGLALITAAGGRRVEVPRSGAAPRANVVVLPAAPPATGAQPSVTPITATPIDAGIDAPAVESAAVHHGTHPVKPKPAPSSTPSPPPPSTDDLYDDRN